MGSSCEEKKKGPGGPLLRQRSVDALCHSGFLADDGELHPYGLLSIIGELIPSGLLYSIGGL